MNAQEEFDRVYITSTELCERLKVTRATIVKRQAHGDLPDCVVVNRGQIRIWKRAAIEPLLDTLYQKIQRKGETRSYSL